MAKIYDFERDSDFYYARYDDAMARGDLIAAFVALKNAAERGDLLAKLDFADFCIENGADKAADDTLIPLILYGDRLYATQAGHMFINSLLLRGEQDEARAVYDLLTSRYGRGSEADGEELNDSELSKIFDSIYADLFGGEGEIQDGQDGDFAPEKTKKTSGRSRGKKKGEDESYAKRKKKSNPLFEAFAEFINDNIVLSLFDADSVFSTKKIGGISPEDEAEYGEIRAETCAKYSDYMFSLGKIKKADIEALDKGKEYLRDGMFKQAIAAFARIHSDSAPFVEARFLIAAAYFCMGDEEGARAQTELNKAYFKENFAGALGVAQMAKLLGDKELYERETALLETLPVSQNALDSTYDWALSCLKGNENDALVKRLCEVLLNAFAFDGEALYSLAVAEYRLGNRDKCRELLRNAVTVDPSNCSAYGLLERIGSGDAEGEDVKTVTYAENRADDALKKLRAEADDALGIALGDIEAGREGVKPRWAEEADGNDGDTFERKVEKDRLESVVNEAVLRRDDIALTRVFSFTDAKNLLAVRSERILMSARHTLEVAKRIVIRENVAAGERHICFYGMFMTEFDLEMPDEFENYSPEMRQLFVTVISDCAFLFGSLSAAFTREIKLYCDGFHGMMQRDDPPKFDFATAFMFIVGESVKSSAKQFIPLLKGLGQLYVSNSDIYMQYWTALGALNE